MHIHTSALVTQRYLYVQPCMAEYRWPKLKLKQNKNGSPTRRRLHFCFSHNAVREIKRVWTRISDSAQTKITSIACTWREIIQTSSTWPPFALARVFKFWSILEPQLARDSFLTGQGLATVHMSSSFTGTSARWQFTLTGVDRRLDSDALLSPCEVVTKHAVSVRSPCVHWRPLGPASRGVHPEVVPCGVSCCRSAFPFLLSVE